MNKHTQTLERAMLRLAKAANTVRDEALHNEMVKMLAERLDENGLYIFFEPTEGLMVTATLKTSQTIH